MPGCSLPVRTRCQGRMGMVSGENALLLRAVRCSSCWRSRMEPCPLKVCKGHWRFGGVTYLSLRCWEQAPGPAHCCEDEWDDFSIAVGWAWFLGTESTWKSWVIHPHRASVLLCRGNSPSLQGAVSSSKSLKCMVSDVRYFIAFSQE